MAGGGYRLFTSKIAPERGADGEAESGDGAADAVGLLLATARSQGATLVIAAHDARVAWLIPPKIMVKSASSPFSYCASSYEKRSMKTMVFAWRYLWSRPFY